MYCSTETGGTGRNNKGSQGMSLKEMSSLLRQQSPALQSEQKLWGRSCPLRDPETLHPGHGRQQHEDGGSAGPGGPNREKVVAYYSCSSSPPLSWPRPWRCCSPLTLSPGSTSPSAADDTTSQNTGVIQVDNAHCPGH